MITYGGGSKGTDFVGHLTHLSDAIRHCYLENFEPGNRVKQNGIMEAVGGRKREEEGEERKASQYCNAYS